MYLVDMQSILNDLQSYDDIDILRTGDIADIDENNYVYITSR